MSLIQMPPKPAGTDAAAKFMQWAWESILSLSRVQDVQGVTTYRTTKGTAQIPNTGNKTIQSTPTDPKVPRWG